MFALNIWRRLGFPFEMALLVQISYSFNHHLDDFIPNARKSMANDQNQLTLLCAHFEPKEKKLSEHFPWWRQTMPSFMCLVQITYPLLSFALEFAASSILLFVSGARKLSNGKIEPEQWLSKNWYDWQRFAGFESFYFFSLELHSIFKIENKIKQNVKRVHRFMRCKSKSIRK